MSQFHDFAFSKHLQIKTHKV